MIYFAHVVVWILRLVVTAPLWLIGLPVCYVLAKRRAWVLEPSPYYQNPDGSPRMLLQWKPRWAKVFNQYEDGVTGAVWWQHAKREWPEWKRAFVWSAWRNPINALRFVYPFGIKLVPGLIQFRGNVQDSPQDDDAREGVYRFRWCYAWQSVYAGLWIRWPYRDGYAQFRIGYKVLPKDARGVPDSDYRSKGCGFGLQFQFRGE